MSSEEKVYLKVDIKKCILKLTERSLRGRIRGCYILTRLNSKMLQSDTFFNLGFLIWSCYKKIRPPRSQEPLGKLENSVLLQWWLSLAELHFLSHCEPESQSDEELGHDPVHCFLHLCAVQHLSKLFFVIYELTVWILAYMTKDHEEACL